MGGIFSASPTPQELFKRGRRILNRRTNALEREQFLSEQQAKAAISRAKMMAEGGDVEGSKTAIRLVAHHRKNANRCMQLQCKLQAMIARTADATTTIDMMRAMKMFTVAIERTNSAVDASAMRSLLMTYEKQEASLEMKQDAMDDVFGEEDTSGQTEEAMYNELVDQIITEKLEGAPSVSASLAPLPRPQKDFH